jgi:putative IMPACT (imprinted ancient) family translation regulator
MEFYNTLAQTGQAEFKDRGSRFIAYAFPINSVDEFKNALLTLKKSIRKLFIIASPGASELMATSLG